MIDLTVELRCSHRIIFAFAIPTMGEKVWCVRCQQYEKVTSRKGVWGWNCKNCSKRGGGTVLKYRVSQSAQRHANETHHVAIMFLEDFTERIEETTISYHRETEPLF